jgi:hypothetical protein
MPSKVRELADAEATRAEAEPDPEPPAADPGTAEPAEPAEPAAPPGEGDDGPSAEEMVARLSTLERDFHDALCAVFGVDGPLEPVTLDGAIGFMLPGADAIERHPSVQRCSTCNGHGRVLTGSTRPGQETVDCPDPRCGGRGYWQKASAERRVEQATPAPANGSGDEWEQPGWLGDTSIAPQPPSALGPVLP